MPPLTSSATWLSDPPAASKRSCLCTAPRGENSVTTTCCVPLELTYAAPSGAAATSPTKPKYVEYTNAVPAGFSFATYPDAQGGEFCGSGGHGGVVAFTNGKSCDDVLPVR